MPVVNYHTVDGLLLGETDASGNRRDYLTDALGSVVATVDQSGAVENRYRYKPYGGFLLQSGAGIEPSFLWTGETGSRRSGAGHAGQYNRARHYSRETGRWTSVDPLWPHESAYGYADGNPATWTDPSGMGGVIIPIVGIATILTIHETLCIKVANDEASHLEKVLKRPHEPIDKLQHCVAYCIATTCMQTKIIASFPGATESGGAWSPQDSPKDIQANKAGISCGSSLPNTITSRICGPLATLEAPDSCYSCCAGKKLDQKLDKDPSYPARPMPKPPRPVTGPPLPGERRPWQPGKSPIVY